MIDPLMFKIAADWISKGKAMLPVIKKPVAAVLEDVEKADLGKRIGEMLRNKQHGTVTGIFPPKKTPTP